MLNTRIKSFSFLCWTLCTVGQKSEHHVSLMAVLSDSCFPLRLVSFYANIGT